jgi:hypothetical protein
MLKITTTKKQEKARRKAIEDGFNAARDLQYKELMDYLTDLFLVNYDFEPISTMLAGAVQLGHVSAEEAVEFTQWCAEQKREKDILDKKSGKVKKLKVDNKK